MADASRASDAPHSTAKAVATVEKLDAGLRSLDHCESLPLIASIDHSNEGRQA